MNNQYPQTHKHPSTQTAHSHTHTHLHTKTQRKTCICAMECNSSSMVQQACRVAYCVCNYQHGKKNWAPLFLCTILADGPPGSLLQVPPTHSSPAPTHPGWSGHVRQRSCFVHALQISHASHKGNLSASHRGQWSYHHEGTHSGGEGQGAIQELHTLDAKRWYMRRKR